MSQIEVEALQGFEHNGRRRRGNIFLVSLRHAAELKDRGLVRMAASSDQDGLKAAAVTSSVTDGAASADTPVFKAVTSEGGVRRGKKAAQQIGKTVHVADAPKPGEGADLPMLSGNEPSQAPGLKPETDAAPQPDQAVAAVDVAKSGDGADSASPSDTGSVQAIGSAPVTDAAKE